MAPTAAEPARAGSALESERLQLWPLAVDDAGQFVGLFDGDWDAVKRTGRMPYPPTEPILRQWIGAHLDGASHAYLVIRKEDGQALGSAGFGGTGALAELGYALGRAYWGRGYATEAVATLVDHARALGVVRLEAFSFVDNPASARVLEKAGFAFLGVIERSYPARGGTRKVRHYRKSL